jgi:hypothetical protein
MSTDILPDALFWIAAVVAPHLAMFLVALNWKDSDHDWY